MIKNQVSCLDMILVVAVSYCYGVIAMRSNYFSLVSGSTLVTKMRWNEKKNWTTRWSKH